MVGVLSHITSTPLPPLPLPLLDFPSTSLAPVLDSVVMRLTSMPVSSSGAFILLWLGRVQALNLQFSRRAASAHYNAPSPSLGAGFGNLLGASDGSHSLAAGDGKDSTALRNVGDIRVR